MKLLERPIFTLTLQLDNSDSGSPKCEVDPNVDAPPASPFTLPPAPSVTDIRALPTALLPTAQHVASPSTLQSTGSPAPALTAPPGLKVLLVEDNKSTLMIMSRLLRQKLQYTVIVASTVGDALKVRVATSSSDIPIV